MAVLQLERARSELRPIAVGRSADLQVDQAAFAIGNPYDLEQTLTSGIISALNRRLPTSTPRLILSLFTGLLISRFLMKEISCTGIPKCLIRTHQTRVARHVGGEDRGEAADRRHFDAPAALFSFLPPKRRRDQMRT